MRSEVIALMFETFALHPKGLREDGDPIPSSRASFRGSGGRAGGYCVEEGLAGVVQWASTRRF